MDPAPPSLMSSEKAAQLALQQQPVADGVAVLLHPEAPFTKKRRTSREQTPNLATASGHAHTAGSAAAFASQDDRDACHGPDCDRWELGRSETKMPDEFKLSVCACNRIYF